MTDFIRTGEDRPSLAEPIVSRRAALGNVGRLGAALVAMAAVPAVLRGRAGSLLAQEALTEQEAAALNFALTLEYLEAGLYSQALAAGFIPEIDQPIFDRIAQHETAHVDVLTGVLGDAAVAEPTFDYTAGGTFPDVFTNYETFLAVAQGVEDTAVRAYKGQAANLQTNGALLTTALQIHSVEGRHAAMVRRLREQSGWIVGADTDITGLEPAYAGEGNTTHLGVDVTTVTDVPADQVTAAFDEPLTQEQVLEVLAPFITDSEA